MPCNWEGTPVNGCSGCGQDFTSLRLFDAHHVGDFALDWPENSKGRRCLDSDEMQAMGWERNARGRWVDPARAEKTRRHFEGAADMPLAAVPKAQTRPARVLAGAPSRN